MKQYIGETADNYKSNGTTIKLMVRGFNRQKILEHLFLNFYNDGRDGFLSNISIAFACKRDAFDPQKRKTFC